MNSQLAVILMAIATVVALVGLVRIPRWFVQPIALGKAWRLLDELDAAVRVGRLPSDHRAVRELRAFMFLTAKVGDQMRLTDVLLGSRSSGLKAHPLPKLSVGDLSPDERQVFHNFEYRHRLIVPFVVFTGTWAGILFMVVCLFRFVFGAVRQAVRRRRTGVIATSGPEPEEWVVADAWGALACEAEREGIRWNGRGTTAPKVQLT